MDHPTTPVHCATIAVINQGEGTDLMLHAAESQDHSFIQSLHYFGHYCDWSVKQYKIGLSDKDKDAING